MRLVACLAMWLMSILASAAQTDAQAPSDPQAYCVNRNADFYPYTGEPCRLQTVIRKTSSSSKIMFVIAQKQTCAVVQAMSAITPIADIDGLGIRRLLKIGGRITHSNPD